MAMLLSSWEAWKPPMSDTPESIREPVPAPYSFPAEESLPNFQGKKSKIRMQYKILIAKYTQV